MLNWLAGLLPVLFVLGVAAFAWRGHRRMKADMAAAAPALRRSVALYRQRRNDTPREFRDIARSSVSLAK